MIYIYIALVFLENSSFSDNNSELSMLDLSSTSVSDSDTDHPIANYILDVPTGEISNMFGAQTTKTKTNNKIKCIRKIHHFLHNYANIKISNYY
jgi:hypothetical protein